MVSQHGVQVPLADGTILGDYRIVRVISSGGFGIVYEGRHNAINQRVAIKEFFPKGLAVRDEHNGILPLAEYKDSFDWARRKFCDEAKAIVSLHDGVRHASVVKVINFHRANNTEYVIMDFEDGEPLKAHVVARGPLKQSELEAILGPILDGLEWVHKMDVLHRDIKPENIIIRKDGTPVLVDFGAAKVDFSDAGVSTMAAYTSAYAAPEQKIVGLHPQGPWTDIFALGGTLYYAITGKSPMSVGPREYAHEGYSGRLIKAIEAALRPACAERPQSVAEFRQLLGLRTTRVVPEVSVIADDTDGLRKRDDANTETNVFAVEPQALITDVTKADATVVLPSDLSETVAPPPSKWEKLVLVLLTGTALLGGALWYFNPSGEDKRLPPSPTTTPKITEAVKTTEIPRPAVPDRAAVQVAVDSALQEQPECAYLRYALNDNLELTLWGNVAKPVDRDTLVGALGKVAGVKKVDPTGLTIIEKPYCDVIATALAYQLVDVAANQQGQIEFSKTDATYKENEFLVVKVTPGTVFDGFIYVDLIDPVGNVVHMQSRAGVQGDPVNRGQTIAFGGGLDADGQRIYRIGRPHGRHYILVTQTKVPLWKTAPPEVEQSARDYAAALRTAIESTQGSEKPLVYYRSFTTHE